MPQKDHCSFCGRSEEEIHRLLRGPAGVAICNECVDLSLTVLSEGMPSPSPSQGRRSARRPGRKAVPMPPLAPALPVVTILYRLLVTLVGSSPTVVRLVQVPATMHFHALHRVPQAAMGWQDVHLYEFQIGDQRYSLPGPENADFGVDVSDSRQITLRELALSAGSWVRYLYDFGDGWEHEIVVQEMVMSGAQATRALCLDGAGVCPPEDVGGIGGYAHLLEVLADPDHPEYEELQAWTGGHVDPAVFDLDAANQRLHRLKSRGR